MKVLLNHSLLFISFVLALLLSTPNAMAQEEDSSSEFLIGVNGGLSSTTRYIDSRYKDFEGQAGGKYGLLAEYRFGQNLSVIGGIDYLYNEQDNVYFFSGMEYDALITERLTEQEISIPIMLRFHVIDPYTVYLSGGFYYSPWVDFEYYQRGEGRFEVTTPLDDIYRSYDLGLAWGAGGNISITERLLIGFELRFTWSVLSLEIDSDSLAIVQINGLASLMYRL